jgi:hypothetical protein
MEWNSLRLAFLDQLKSIVRILRKLNFMQRHENDAIGDTVVIANLKVATGKLVVPTDAAEQFVNGSHDVQSPQRLFERS